MFGLVGESWSSLSWVVGRDSEEWLDDEEDSDEEELDEEDELEEEPSDLDSDDSLEWSLEEESLDDSRLDSLGDEIWSGRRPTQESRWVKRSKPLKLARTSTVPIANRIRIIWAKSFAFFMLLLLVRKYTIIIIAILHKKATSTHQNRGRL